MTLQTVDIASVDRQTLPTLRFLVKGTDAVIWRELGCVRSGQPNRRDVPFHIIELFPIKFTPE